MKKVFFIILTLPLFFCSSCKKDGVFNPKEKIVAVYQQSTSSDGTGTPSVVDKYKAEEWIWDGKLLKEIVSYTPDGTTSGRQLLTYDCKRLVKVSDESGAYYTEYTYKSGKLTKIVIMSDGSEMFAADVQHDGSFISKMTMTMEMPDSIGADFAKRSLSMVIPKPVADLVIGSRSTKAAQTMTVSLNFSYTDKNLTKVTVSMSGMTFMTVSCTYDQKKNPMQGCYAFLSPSALSKNNLVEVKTGGLINSMPIEGIDLPTNQKYTYTYNSADYPETVSTTASLTQDGVTTTTSSTTFYVYGE